MKDKYNDDEFNDKDFDEEEDDQLIGGDKEDTIDGEAEEVETEDDQQQVHKKPKKKQRKTREPEYEEEDDEEYEDEYEDGDEDYEYEEDDDGGSGKKKIIIISIAAAVIIAAAGIFTYQKIKGNREAQEAQQAVEEQQQAETEEASESEEEPEETPEVTEIPEVTEEAEEPEDTIAPTSTPKPLPTATPSATPYPEETDDDYNDEYNDGYTDSQVDEINNNGDDSISAGEAAENSEPADIIFLGDLRFRSMANVATGESALWECSSSATYSWLADTAYPDVDARVGEGTQVFISMGINDLTMYQSYTTSINAKAAEWEEKGAKVYFVAVGPVSQTSETANADIMTFNTYMYQNLNIPFIDAYNYLVEQGFETTDGQTYTDATSKTIYDYLMRLIGR